MYLLISGVKLGTKNAHENEKKGFQLHSFISV